MEGPPSTAALSFELLDRLAFDRFGGQPARVSVGGGSRGSKGTKNKNADDDDAGYTTVMLWNIPNEYTRDMLIEQVHSSGFRGEIDYLYLPITRRNRCNVGYCFANFRTAAARQRFGQVFGGKAVQSCLPGFNSSKVCQVSRATYQGREENVEWVRSRTPLMSLVAANPQWLPLLLDEAGNVETLHLAQGPGPASGMPERRGGRESAWAAPRGSEHRGGHRDAAGHFPSGSGDYCGRGSGREGPGRQRRGGRGILVATEHGVQCMPYDAAYDVGRVFANWWNSEGGGNEGGLRGHGPSNVRQASEFMDQRGVPERVPC